VRLDFLSNDQRQPAALNFSRKCCHELAKAIRFDRDVRLTCCQTVHKHVRPSGCWLGLNARPQIPSHIRLRGGLDRGDTKLFEYLLGHLPNSRAAPLTPVTPSRPFIR
jgi:hypothetical protein